MPLENNLKTFVFHFFPRGGHMNTSTSALKYSSNISRLRSVLDSMLSSLTTQGLPPFELSFLCLKNPGASDIVSEHPSRRCYVVFSALSLRSSPSPFHPIALSVSCSAFCLVRWSSSRRLLHECRSPAGRCLSSRQSCRPWSRQITSLSLPSTLG